MTKDTERALEVLRPLCEELQITLNADEKRLYIDGETVQISGNSTYVTIMEALGALFVKEYPKFRGIYEFALKEVRGAVSLNWLRKK